MTTTSPTDMMAAVTESMKARTGRTLEQWVTVVANAGIDPIDQNGVRRWLGLRRRSAIALPDPTTPLREDSRGQPEAASSTGDALS